MTANVGSLNFLRPAQSPGELGRLGPYRVLKVLGQGGMGVVFLAEDPNLQRTVALKAMLPEVATRASARERFLREARATAKIEHDHIVTIYQVGEDRGVPYLAMQLLKGMSLEDYLRKKQGQKAGAPPTLDQVLKLGREIAKGLSAAHERGLIHRDIKPANIWLDAMAGGRVKILDFGLARAAEGESHLTQLGTLVGTPAYMAPEQARGEEIDGRADLFSLGCVLYRLCTGRLPWKGHDATDTLMAVATEESIPVQQLNPALPPLLARLVMQLLAKRAKDRPASARAVVEAIQAIEREQPTMQIKGPIPVAVPLPDTASSAWLAPTVVATVVPPRPALRRRSSGRRLRIFAALAALTALVLAAASIYVQTDTGTLKIETADDDVQVIVEQNGKRVDVLDKKNGTKVTLHTGDYQLRLSEPRKDVKLDKDRIQITRDGVVVATITKVQPSGVARSKDGSATRPPNPVDTRPPESVRYVFNSIGMKLAPIPSGKFLMGTSAADIERFKKEPFHGYDYPGWEKAESPQHEVRITRGFLMGAYEVTQGQYEKVMNTNPSANKDRDHPVEMVNWDDAVEFCKRLSALPAEKQAGRVYRLPTEAEWEYACRAGTTTAFYYGNSLSFRQANFNGTQPFGTAEKGPPSRGTTRVGSYAPNAWGLYDMHGNVWEWCLDGQRTYTAEAVTDPRGPETPGADRILRGGGWPNGACRSAFRKARSPSSYRTNNCGFRVVCEP